MWSWVRNVCFVLRKKNLNLFKGKKCFYPPWLLLIPLPLHGHLTFLVHSTTTMPRRSWTPKVFIEEREDTSKIEHKHNNSSLERRPKNGIDRVKGAKNKVYWSFSHSLSACFWEKYGAWWSVINSLTPWPLRPLGLFNCNQKAEVTHTQLTGAFSIEARTSVWNSSGNKTLPIKYR